MKGIMMVMSDAIIAADATIPRTIAAGERVVRRDAMNGATEQIAPICWMSNLLP